ncbi:hypothetical protein DL93DRAFT_2084166 [Clavulina sp. PMI_390]|nr:hypothetical protein DL93DRAFT_2084166 [Clavulina sp. PMI_390]
MDSLSSPHNISSILASLKDLDIQERLLHVNLMSISARRAALIKQLEEYDALQQMYLTSGSGSAASSTAADPDSSSNSPVEGQFTLPEPRPPHSVPMSTRNERTFLFVQEQEQLEDVGDVKAMWEDDQLRKEREISDWPPEEDHRSALIGSPEEAGYDPESGRRSGSATPTQESIRQHDPYQILHHHHNTTLSLTAEPVGGDLQTTPSTILADLDGWGMTANNEADWLTPEQLQEREEEKAMMDALHDTDDPSKLEMWDL